MRQPITPLRLDRTARRNLERLANETGRSMAEVVTWLLTWAASHHIPWPPPSGRRPPARGKHWHRNRARGQASIAPDAGDDDAPTP